MYDRVTRFGCTTLSSTLYFLLSPLPSLLFFLSTPYLKFYIAVKFIIVNYESITKGDIWRDSRYWIKYESKSDYRWTMQVAHPLM